MSSLRHSPTPGLRLSSLRPWLAPRMPRGRSSYTDGLSLASFRETSELEYRADDDFILAPGEDDGCNGAPCSRVVLNHLKSRHGESQDIPLTFDRKHQRFTPAEPPETGKPGRKRDNGKLHPALQALWNQSRVATDSEGEEP